MTTIEKLVQKIDPDQSITNLEGRFLYQMAKLCPPNGVIVEIGSWKGRSTIWLAKGSQAGAKVKIYAIDPHTGSGWHKKRTRTKIWTQPEFLANLKKARVNKLVTPLVKTSAQARLSWGNKPIALLFIDGDHDYPLVKKDFQLWTPLVMPYGVIAFHDSDWSGPKQVLREDIYCSNNFGHIGRLGTITYATKLDHFSLAEKLNNYHSLTQKSWQDFTKSFYHWLWLRYLKLPKFCQNTLRNWRRRKIW